MYTPQFARVVTVLILFATRPSASAYAQSSTDSQGSRAEGAAVVLTVNLALENRQDLPVAPGVYSIILSNTIPDAIYSVVVGPAQVFEQSPLTSIDLSSLAPATAFTPEAANCGAALRAIDSLRQVPADEKQVSERLEVARNAVSTCADVRIATTFSDITKQFTTTVPGLRVTVPPDSRTFVLITRDSHQWEVTFSSVPRGRWQMMFGVTLALNRDEEYFAQPDGAGGFRVAQERPPELGSFTSLPSVLWTWLPPDQAFADVQQGFTVGIGLSTQKGLRHTALLIGYTIRHNQNIGVVGGFAFHPQKRLDGRYSLHEMLSENLEPDKLNESQIRWNLFFGALFRLGASP